VVCRVSEITSQVKSTKKFPWGGAAPPRRPGPSPPMRFDDRLKKADVTLEAGSSICRGPSASRDVPNGHLQNYWSCLCDQPLVRNTGRHTVTLRLLSKGTAGQSGGWAVVGMASPESATGTGPGGTDDSVGMGSDGTSSVGPSSDGPMRIEKVWPCAGRVLTTQRASRRCAQLLICGC
jgi:hypothetical protein